jgi:hypothetical protein
MNVSLGAFGAYNPAVWTLQWILTNLGYYPGAIDGLWGNNTFGAVSDFRQLNNLPPASDVTYAGAVDATFTTALWGQALEQGLNVPVAPGSSGGSSGGTVRPPSGGSTSGGSSTSGGGSLPGSLPGSSVATAGAASGISPTTIAIVGVALLGTALFLGSQQKGGKRRRR